MRYIRVPIPDKNGSINILEVGDFEYVNPIEKMAEITVSWHMRMESDFFRFMPELAGPFTRVLDKEKIIHRVLAKRALKYWFDELERSRTIALPHELKELLTCSSKKHQLKALKEVRFDPETFMAFIYDAWETFGYRYSMYTAEHTPHGLVLDQMPKLAYKEKDGDVLIIGKTKLSKGQIKSVIDQRTVTIAKFLDNGENWHCFYYTYKSLSGKEIGGIPHIHYISSAWDLSRAQVLSEIKKGKYKLPRSIHIPYKRHSSK